LILENVARNILYVECGKVCVWQRHSCPWKVSFFRLWSCVNNLYFVIDLFLCIRYDIDLAPFCIRIETPLKCPIFYLFIVEKKNSYLVIIGLRNPPLIPCITNILDHKIVSKIPNDNLIVCLRYHIQILCLNLCLNPLLKPITKKKKVLLSRVKNGG